jgi:hypothetical protein
MCVPESGASGPRAGPEFSPDYTEAIPAEQAAIEPTDDYAARAAAFHHLAGYARAGQVLPGERAVAIVFVSAPVIEMFSARGRVNVDAQLWAGERRDAFELEQELLALQSASVPVQSTVRIEHAVTGHNDAERVRTGGLAHCSLGLGAADAPGQLAVRKGAPVRDLQNASPDGELKGRAPQVERHGELLQSPAEIRSQLLLQLSQVAVRSDRDGASPLIRQVPDRVAPVAIGKRDQARAAVGGRQPQTTYRAAQIVGHHSSQAGSPTSEDERRFPGNHHSCGVTRPAGNTPAAGRSATACRSPYERTRRAPGLQHEGGLPGRCAHPCRVAPRNSNCVGQ